MAIQYYMRAYNTTLSQFVDWIVNDAPDTTGNFSGYPTNQLSNIVVNRIISSKVDNFLKPNHSLGGADGYYLHINSYDWLRALTSPVAIPPNLKAGLAIERGTTLITTVTDASNATPIQIATLGTHGLSTGSLVTITGVLGNLAANGTFPIITTGTNSFTLVGSSGSGTYTSGGQVFRPTDFSTLTWDEVGQTWRFVVNTNGDGTTLGASQELRVLNLNIDGYLSLGTDPADTGIIRLPNNQFIASESNPTGTDLILLGADPLNRIRVGSTATDIVYMPGRLVVDGYISHDGTATSVAQTGFIRELNNTTIIAFRNQLQNADIAALSSTTGNLIVLGDSVNSGINYNTSTANLHNFQVAGTTFLELGNLNGAAPFSTSAFARFSQGASTPVIGQTTATVGTGQTMTVQAQSTTAASQTGGILQLASGRGTGGGGFDGALELYTGTPTGGGAVKIRIHPNTTSVPANNETTELFNRVLRFDDTMVLPFILQDATAGATGTHLTIQSQSASSTGGNLILSSGTGTSAGNVIIRTGNANQIIVTPTLTTILGNLLVNGTTTSVASTVVEIADRVINLNSSANQFPGTTVPAPTQITGFAIDRGSTNNTTKRDYFGLFWSETDGYWRFAVNTDGYTTQNTLFSTLPTLASAYMAQPSAAVPVNAALIPTVGGFRSLNNTVHSASRNVAGTQDLILVSTDATNHLIWGAGTQNAGHIFNTTTGTIYDFQVNSVSTYTITPQSTGTTTLQATSGVTALVYSQATTGAASGAPTSLQAQSAATNGGNLILSSGQGSADANDGYVAIETGNNDRMIIRNAFTEFRDNSGEALRVTYVSTGTTQITYASTVTAAQINQTATGGATGAPMTIAAQGAATTGGSLTLTSGTGATGGDVNIQTGAVSRVIVHPTFTEFRDTAEAYRITPVSSGTTVLQAASTVTLVQYRQADLTTNGGTGATTILQAQNETGTTSTGGALILTSGTGTTVAGDTRLQTGGVDKVIVHPTFTEFRDTAEAVRVTPVSAGTTQITFASTVTAASINHTTTGGATGANLTIQAQNAATTGGNTVITSGTGATAGNVQIQTGAVDKIIVRPTFTEFRDTAEAVRITPVSAGTTSVEFATTVTAARIFQTDLTTASGTGAALTVQAQNETGATSTGGALNLTSGTGTTTHGAVNLQVGGTTTASVVTNKFVFNRGRRRNVTQISSGGGTYAVLATDDLIAITTLAAPFQINLPTTPTLGDTYEVKDTTGNAGASTVTVSGNGANIDGSTTFLLTSAYAAATFTYTGAQWSVT
jgi:hypothetical protein